MLALKPGMYREAERVAVRVTEDTPECGESRLIAAEAATKLGTAGEFIAPEGLARVCAVVHCGNGFRISVAPLRWSDNMSEKTTTDASKKKRRSPVERAVVWGLIGILLAVVLWEGWARFGYSRTLSRWQNALATADRGDGSSALTLAEAERMVSGSPAKSASERQGPFQVVTYRWKSLFGRNYAISVSMTGGDAPEVVGLETADAPEDEEPADSAPLLAEQNAPAPQKSDELPATRSSSDGKTAAKKSGKNQEERTADDASEQGQEASGPVPGPLAGVAGFIMGSMDRDGDAKLSPDEAPERIRPHFSNLDQDGDGFLDYNEVYTARSIEEMEAEQQRPRGASETEASASNEAP